MEVSWTRQPAEDGSPYEADVALAITPLMEPLLAIPDWFYKVRDANYAACTGTGKENRVTDTLHMRSIPDNRCSSERRQAGDTHQG